MSRAQSRIRALVASVTALCCSGMMCADEKPVPCGEYRPFLGEGGRGTMFVMSYLEYLCAGASLHQFGSEGPKAVQVTESKFLPLTGRPFLQKDVQDLKVDLAETRKSAVPHLKYDPHYKLLKFESLAIITATGNAVRGDMVAPDLEDCCYRSNAGPTELGLNLKKPLSGIGLSGAPIVKWSTGQVVGVVLGGNDLQVASAVKFETIFLPGPQKGPSRAKAFTPGKLYGIPYKKPVPPDLESFVFSKVFPPVSGEVDMSQDTLKVKGRIEKGRGNVGYPLLDSCLLFSEIIAMGGKGAPRPGMPGKLWRFENRIAINPAVTKDRLEKLVTFLQTAYGDLHLFFVKSIGEGSKAWQLRGAGWEMELATFVLSLQTDSSSGDVGVTFWVNEAGEKAEQGMNSHNRTELPPDTFLASSLEWIAAHAKNERKRASSDRV